ncbi:MAG: riboflavin biosynthesis protein RibF [Endomicrobia bacterium]|nr:riboflavin biosynthesis protein RibF [Endomicrobiia bacterium]
MANTKYVCTIGFFDGVHLGHQALLSIVRDIQRNNGLNSIVYTFNEVAKLNYGFITTIEEKVKLLKGFDIDKILVLNFSEIKNLSPSEFFEKYIVKKNIFVVVSGRDFRFGKQAAADIHLLSKLCKKYKIASIIIDDYTISDEHKLYSVSSSVIRQKILAGDFCLVEKMLGRNYYITGEVVEGRKVGSLIGVPTINVLTDDSLILPKGVIAGICKIADIEYYSVANFGFRPTVDGRNFLIEIHIINNDFEIRKIGKVSFRPLRKIRDERKFNTLIELRRQILKDKKIASNLFNKILRRETYAN